MGMRLVIRARDGLAENEACYEFDQARVVIGRGAGADVRLPHPSVSHAHAVIREEGVGYALVDDGSTNGTRVNGQPVVTGRPKRLRDGDRIEVGVFSGVFSAGLAVAQGTSAERTAALARRFIRELWTAGSVPVPSLTVTEGPDQGRSAELPPPPGRFVVGRGETCDLVLRDADVSREHLAFTCEPSGVHLLDLDSKNGMRVNDRSVPERRLKDGDEVHIGATRLVYEDPAQAHLLAVEREPDTKLDRSQEREPSEDGPSTEITGPEPDTGARLAPPKQSPPPRRPGTAGADLVIYLLAGCVFLLSLAGLFLLLRG
jgi:pSer/pThr/pTyr-binding forkhead associated (FHA) protein